MSSNSPLLVAGVDRSERATIVLKSAAELARKLGAEVVLVHVVGIPVPLPSEALAIPVDNLDEVLVNDARRDLDARVAALPAEDRAVIRELRVEIGNAWTTICDLAKQLDAALIVVGTHGYSGLDRLLGTTAARITNHAPCSVFVIRGAGPGLA